LSTPCTSSIPGADRAHATGQVRRARSRSAICLPENEAAMADNDDYDFVEDEMEAIETEVLQQKTSHRAATHTLPELMISLTLKPEQVARLRRDRTTCMVIEAPSAEWVDPLLRAAKRLGEWKFFHAASEPPRKTYNNGTTASDQAIFAMAAGGRILGVSQNLSYL